MEYKDSQKQPVFEVLTKLFPDCAKNTLRSWIKQRRVHIDGRVVTARNTLVKPGQHVTLCARKKIVTGGLKILYDDQHLAVIEKPAGLLTVATDHETNETTHEFLKDYYYPRRVHVVHRLDRGSSGVMLFALNELALKGLKETFQKHDIERVYIALVEGQMEEQEGTWQSRLYEDANYVVKTTTNPQQGRLAITHYRTLKTNSKYSLLQCALETGRKNQIRVQSAAAGHPIAGDKK